MNATILTSAQALAADTFKAFTTGPSFTLNSDDIVSDRGRWGKVMQFRGTVYSMSFAAIRTEIAGGDDVFEVTVSGTHQGQGFLTRVGSFSSDMFDSFDVHGATHTGPGGPYNRIQDLLKHL